MLLFQGRDLDDWTPVHGGVDETTAADAQSYVCDLFPPEEHQVSRLKILPIYHL